MKVQRQMKVQAWMSLLAAATLVAQFWGCASRSPAKREVSEAERVQSKAEKAQTEAKAGEGASLSGLGPTESTEGSSEISLRKEVIEKHRIPTLEERELKADVNRLDQAGFVALGLKPDIAESIVEYREEHGRFSSAQELQKVPGMDLSWFEQMKGMLGTSEIKAG